MTEMQTKTDSEATCFWSNATDVCTMEGNIRSHNKNKSKITRITLQNRQKNV